MSKIVREKPSKPYDGYPLTPHPSGRWCKKIRGKIHYFGTWDDPDAALAKYLDQRDDLQAGRKPRDKTDAVSVRDLINRFLTTKRQLVDTGELSPRTFADYRATCLRLADAFGKSRVVSDLRPDDFEAFRADTAKTRGPLSLGDEVRRTRSLFKYAHEAGLIETPMRFGPAFKMPGRKVVRQARNQSGSRMFEADELRTILGAAKRPMRAMILLGINGGFGQSDCSSLPLSAVDLEAGWIDFPRPKTAVHRRVPLWPETSEALQEAIDKRPRPKLRADADLVFLTRQGRSWVRMERRKEIEVGELEWTPIDSAGLMFGKLLRQVGLKRPGLNFYALRHTFETIAGESRDQVAVNAIMGHDPGDMASLYRERIGDDRLRAVVDHVRAWLFGNRGEL